MLLGIDPLNRKLIPVRQQQDQQWLDLKLRLAEVEYTQIARKKSPKSPRPRRGTSKITKSPSKP
jgi:hypothetical protein